LLDTNVFIASAKRGWTGTTELVVRLIEGQEDLIADDALIGEYRKYAAGLGNYGQMLLNRILEKASVLEPSDAEIALCLPFFPVNQEADALHAATCLSVGGILISNDKHFEKIRNARIVEVWMISEAIKRFH
jgi:predicted nucleic acid-binding protein